MEHNWNNKELINYQALINEPLDRTMDNGKCSGGNRKEKRIREKQYIQVKNTQLKVNLIN